MSDIVIHAEGLGKIYRIGARQRTAVPLRQQMRRALSTPWRRLRAVLSNQSALALTEIFWALKDVTFDVQQGEVLGIIGRNGAGKSTLLKLLARITEPTEGYADITGQVSSLLEVGTGFHGDLTGRENVYMNGAILGMRRVEIERKFDEIVQFAGVEPFIDTPVKFYSSGMSVRLAFAVAAHLEPDVLLIDEVLAVGDVAFQRKCLGKMDEVSKRGRTVLFVSHNMQAITRLCSRAILLEEGRVVANGPAQAVVSRYLLSGADTIAAREWPDIHDAPGTEVVRLRAVRIRAEDGRVSETLDVRRPFTVEFEVDVLEAGHVFIPSFRLINEFGVTVFVSIDTTSPWAEQVRPVGRYVSAIQVPGNLLAEGSFYVAVSMATSSTPIRKHLHQTDAVAFTMVDPGEDDSARGRLVAGLEGVVRPLLNWETRLAP